MICKSCGSEVSPYITECPYCGNRLRKRAPKLDRHGRVSERSPRRVPSPTLGRLRRGEIPGIRHDAHAYATIALVVAGLAGCLVWRTQVIYLSDLVITGTLGRHWWRIFTAPFSYANTGYAFVALSLIALYGTLNERRHGPVAVIALFLAGGVGGTALSVEASSGTLVMGGSGAALALLVAWSMQDLLSLRAGEEIEGDLLGTAVLGAVMLLMPLAVPQASWISAGVGILAGVVIGFPLARVHPA